VRQLQTNRAQLTRALLGADRGITEPPGPYAEHGITWTACLLPNTVIAVIVTLRDRKVADLATEAIESSAHATFLGGTTDSGSHCGPVGLTDSLPGDTSYKVDLGQSAKSPEEFQERPITIITDEGRYILVDEQMQGL